MGGNERDETVSEMENCETGNFGKAPSICETGNFGRAPSIAEGIEQLCLGEELTAVVASRLGRLDVL